MMAAAEVFNSEQTTAYARSWTRRLMDKGSVVDQSALPCATNALRTRTARMRAARGGDQVDATARQLRLGGHGLVSLALRPFACCLMVVCVCVCACVVGVFAGYE